MCPAGLLSNDRVVVVFFCIIGAAFAAPVGALVRYAYSSDVHSYVLLIPFVSLYLATTRRRCVPPTRNGSPVIGVCAVGLGLMGLLASLSKQLSETWSVGDVLSLQTAAFLLCVAGGLFLFWGAAWVRERAFPVAFLALMIPLPDRVLYALENGFQVASADAAALLFGVSGVPVFREGQVFHLPGISLEVALECSGIRSSLVLFITAMLCGYLFLKSGWRRALLVAFVIPLGIVRNGIRIVTLGLLCVHFGAGWIDSVIHKRGGPLYFGLSLIPLAALLYWLNARERRLDSRLKT
jgi:exosortase C (VPDSG-CTERM-specific)